MRRHRSARDRQGDMALPPPFSPSLAATLSCFPVHTEEAEEAEVAEAVEGAEEALADPDVYDCPISATQPMERAPIAC